MGPHTPASGDPVAAALDGATRDVAVSGDAMRWSPDLADQPPGLPATGMGVLPGVDSAIGLGAALGLDGTVVQRLATGPLLALPVGVERPQLTAGPAASADGDSEGE